MVCLIAESELEKRWWVGEEREFEASKEEDELVMSGTMGGERLPTRAPKSRRSCLNQLVDKSLRDEGKLTMVREGVLMGIEVMIGDSAVVEVDIVAGDRKKAEIEADPDEKSTRSRNASWKLE
ncbi:hypothetical protein E3N88_22730 [Mikania micrantha]|uniref:Uncharacterized protein n=1 Tax=Mikania micrantha TaxID=192012 RepID=A0A5N6NCC5_9ASTR|nr:hypothetical protein E3N88_22730 [Mikania micrantha]